MIVIKYIILFLIFTSSGIIGKMMSKRYSYRLYELEEVNNALNLVKSKINFTYDPLMNVFEDVANNVNKNIGEIFFQAKENMKYASANLAWEEAIEKTENNLSKQDREVLKNLGKMLGQTDIDGQISQIEITQSLIKKQIQDAENAKQKNEKLYSKLGVIIGLTIVIILF